MNERDELFQLMIGRTTTKAVDRILAAGYRKPRTVTTFEELSELPFESVIRDFGGHVLERWGEPHNQMWATVMVNAFISLSDIELPVDVLYTPEAVS